MMKCNIELFDRIESCSFSLEEFSIKLLISMKNPGFVLPADFMRHMSKG